MKAFICLFAALIACVSGSVLSHAPVAVAHAPVAVAHTAALLSTGTSSSSRTQDAAGNYAFAYNEQHSTGGSSRSESGSPGVKVGSYTLNVADGRQRVVNYQADALGFRAAIATNEPGTAAQPAASTSISSPHLPPAPVAPLAVAQPAVAVAHAPAVAVAHAPAPVHLAAPAPVHLAPAPVHLAPAPVHLAPQLVHAPLHHAAILPAVSSYSTAINHGLLPAPVLHAPHLAPAW